MILATVRMIFPPEKRSDLLKTIMGILEPVRVERGCLSYRLYEDVDDRNSFVLLQEWSTQPDLEKHLSKDSNRRLLAVMELLSEQPEIRFNTVSHSMGMDFIEDVLRLDGRDATVTDALSGSM